MAATPNLQRIIDEVRAEFGPTRVGVCNCRHTRLGGGRTGGWSHHAWCNAGDFYPDNRAQGDAINDYLRRNRDRLSVFQILWWARSTFTGNRVSDHYDHLHIVPWPYGIGTPPCAGGRLQLRYRDGTTGTDWTATTGNNQGVNMANEIREVWATIQSALIDAGYDLGDYDGYVSPSGEAFPQGADGIVPVDGVSYGALVSALSGGGLRSGDEVSVEGSVILRNV